MVQINGISQGTKKYEELDIMGFRIKAYVQLNADGTGAYAKDQTVDPSKLLLNCSLLRGKKPFSIIGTDYEAVIAGSNFFDAAFTVAVGKKGAESVAAGKVVYTIDLIFETVYNLRHSDALVIEANVLEGFYAGTLLNTAACQLEIEPIHGIGLELGSSYLNSMVVPTNESKFVVNLGNNITEIVLFDKDNMEVVNHADWGVQQVKIKSDKLLVDYDKIDLLTNRRSMFETIEQANARGNCLPIYKGTTDLDEVKLEINFDPSKVTASRYVIFYRTRYEDVRLIELALARQDKHEQANISKLL